MKKYGVRRQSEAPTPLWVATEAGGKVLTVAPDKSGVVPLFPRATALHKAFMHTRCMARFEAGAFRAARFPAMAAFG